MTQSAAIHLSRLAAMPCALCGMQPAEVHHLLEGRTKGRKSGHYTAIPLCPDCHRGSGNGIHGKRRLWNVLKKTELELLGETIERILYGPLILALPQPCRGDGKNGRIPSV